MNREKTYNKLYYTISKKARSELLPLLCLSMTKKPKPI